MRRREASPEFKAAFEAAFGRAQLKSTRAKYLQVDLEVVSDRLAGPMYSVLTSGSHEYVFNDRENRFSGVADAAGFRVWAVSVARTFEASVIAFQPHSEVEERDREVLVQRANSMLRVIDAAEAEVSRVKPEMV